MTKPPTDPNPHRAWLDEYLASIEADPEFIESVPLSSVKEALTEAGYPAESEIAEKVRKQLAALAPRETQRPRLVPKMKYWALAATVLLAGIIGLMSAGPFFDSELERLASISHTAFPMAQAKGASAGEALLAEGEAKLRQAESRTFGLFASYDAELVGEAIEDLRQAYREFGVPTGEAANDRARETAFLLAKAHLALGDASAAAPFLRSLAGSPGAFHEEAIAITSAINQ